MRIWLLAIAAVALITGATTAPQAAGQAAPSVGVDTNTQGNSAAKLGDIQNCLSVEPGDTFDIDVFVRNVQKLSGFQFPFSYNKDVLQVVESDDDLFMGTLQGSNVLSFSDQPPDSDGTYTVAATEFGEIGATDESGDGVLTRLSLKAIKAGESPLRVSDLVLITPGPGGEPAYIEPADPETGFFKGLILNAAVAVGQSCTPPPPPAPSPDLTVGPQDGGPGTTPGPGTPQGDGSTTPTAPQLTATAQGTPVAAASPTPDGDAGSAAEEGDDGLSPGAWAGIAGGIVAAALAALGTALWLRRRRSHVSEIG